VKAIWAIYNFIRYFYSYPKYTSSQGQTAALALATSSSLSFAFLGCATLLSVFKAPLARNIPPRASHVIRKVLRPISTCLILAPAVLNVIFVCIWRYSGVSELSHRSRCYLDIDVIWSISGGQCVSPAWGAWLILALIRLAITLVVIVRFTPQMRSALVDNKFRFHITSSHMPTAVPSDCPTPGDKPRALTSLQRYYPVPVIFWQKRYLSIAIHSHSIGRHVLR
jgi:hypothetical protein